MSNRSYWQTIMVGDGENLMETKIKITPYTEATAIFKVRDLVQVKGLKSVYMVVTRCDDMVDLMPLVNKNGEYALGCVLQNFNVTELIHYNGSLTINQGV